MLFWEKLLETIQEAYEPVSASGTGEVTLDTGGRPYISIWYRSPVASTISVYGSHDGNTWRHLRDIIASAGEEDSTGFIFAGRYIRVVGPGCEFEVFATR